MLRSEHLSSINTCRAAKTHNKCQIITRERDTHTLLVFLIGILVSVRVLVLVPVLLIVLVLISPVL